MSVIGASGSGKSYWTGWLLEQKVPEFDLAVHFDLEDEEIGLSDSDHDPLYGTIRVDKDKFALIDWVKCLFRHRKVRVVPEGLTDEENEELYGRICAAVMSLCKDLNHPDAPESALVSCDETHNVLNKNKLDSRVNRMITGGRKHGVESIHITQRPQLMPLTVLSQSDRRVYFRIGEKRDIDKINKVSSFDANELSNLKSREYIIENDSSGEWKKEDSNGVPRIRPHYSGDDGVLNDALSV